MKLDPTRVFEYEMVGNIWRVEFSNDTKEVQAVCVAGHLCGTVGLHRTLAEVVNDDGGNPWQEVTEVSPVQSFEEVTMLRELLTESQEREKAVRAELCIALARVAELEAKQ